MSKLDLISESAARRTRSRRKSGTFGHRARILLLGLTTALALFVIYTQPPVRQAFDTLLASVLG
ncbi:MAG: hypothetical protein ACR2O2_12530 [Ruegeria sp.]